MEIKVVKDLEILETASPERKGEFLVLGDIINHKLIPVLQSNVEYPFGYNDFSVIEHDPTFLTDRNNDICSRQKFTNTRDQETLLGKLTDFSLQYADGSSSSSVLVDWQVNGDFYFQGTALILHCVRVPKIMCSAFAFFKLGDGLRAYPIHGGREIKYMNWMKRYGRSYLSVLSKKAASIEKILPERPTSKRIEFREKKLTVTA